MKRPSRRTVVIASISAGTVVVLVAGAIIALAFRADAEARSSYDEASAAVSVATSARNTARIDLATAQGVAVQSANDGYALAAVDPTLLADPATTEGVQTATTALMTAAGLVETEGTVVAPAPIPRVVAGRGSVPETRDGLLAAAAEFRAQTEKIVMETTVLEAEITGITTALADLSTSSAVVAASAFAFGTTATPPERASDETIAAFAAAVSALEAPDADANYSALVRAYSDAWAAAVASDAAVRASSGAAEPTYIRGILIVNKTYALPSTYGNGLTTETTNAFAAMQADAAAAGHNIYIASGFRSFASQKSIYNRYVANEGQDGADRHSARPGHSEHQSGLTFDLNSITTAFGSTPEGIWVRDNAHKYGFIVRYPPGKEAITGYVWEPWHLRYLGTTVATELFNSGETLEEYLGVTSVYS